MKSTLLSLILCVFSHLLQAQIGLTGSFVKINAPDWESEFAASNQYVVNPDFKFKPTYQLGLDYWFRLKDYRVEFYPTIGYAQFKQELALANGPAGYQPSQFKLTFWSLAVHTNIYPFDLEGDCHCPTWSKQNPFFKKGFFFQVSPGLVLNQQDIKVSSVPPIQFATSSRAFSLGAGLGLDIGISDLITLTPFARFTRTFNVNWENLHDQLKTTFESTGTVTKSNVDALEAGIRLGIRWTKY